MDHLDDEADRFGRLARRFIELVEADGADRLGWLADLHEILSDLYAAAVHLPDAGVISDGLGPRLGAEEISRICRELELKVGHNFYWTVLDPLNRGAGPPEPAVGSLIDDLADIYGDLWTGLALKEQGAAVQDVIWAWRVSFITHWQGHALDAMRAIREVLR
jgi:hypothetical protein